MPWIKPSILVSRLLPFQRLEHKLLLILLVSVSIPMVLIGMHWMQGEIPEPFWPDRQTIIVGSLLSLFIALFIVYLLFRPINLLIRAVEHYHLHGDDPGLPSYFCDETGRLLGNIQLLIRTAKKQERLLKAASMEEYLSEVYNRGWCERKLTGEIERARFNNEPLSVGVMTLENLEYLKSDCGPSIAQYCMDHVLSLIRGNSPVEHWVAKWGEGQILVVLWASDHEAQVIFNRIQSGLKSATLRTPMGKPISLDLRQCLHHVESGDNYTELNQRLEDGISELKKLAPNSRLVQV
jgi:GGDEF domain-containing protein